MPQDRKDICTVIKSEKLNFSTRPLLVSTGRKKEENGVKINLKKEGNIVRIIEVICSCGNKIELFCEYENETSQ